MRTSIRNTSSNTVPSSILNSAVTSFTSALLSTLVYYFVKALTQLEGLLKSVISVAGRRLFGCGYFLLLVSGCASYGVVENTPKSPQSSDQEYSLKEPDKYEYIKLNMQLNSTCCIK